MSFSSESSPIDLLYRDPEARSVLFYLTDALAGTLLQIAGSTHVKPERVRDVLQLLERADLAERIGGGTSPYSGVFSPSEKGLRVARDIRSGKGAS